MIGNMLSTKEDTVYHSFQDLIWKGILLKEYLDCLILTWNVFLEEKLSNLQQKMEPLTCLFTNWFTLFRILNCFRISDYQMIMWLILNWTMMDLGIIFGVCIPHSWVGIWVTSSSMTWHILDWNIGWFKFTMTPNLKKWFPIARSSFQPWLKILWKPVKDSYYKDICLQVRIINLHLINFMKIF